MQQLTCELKSAYLWRELFKVTYKDKPDRDIDIIYKSEIEFNVKMNIYIKKIGSLRLQSC